MIKKLIDSGTKTGMDVAKTTSKRVVQKTEQATGDLIGNKMADKINSVDTKVKKKKMKDKKSTYQQKKDSKL